ncbi:MAG: hypothetical protein V3W34_05820 [Phycisphaerae bacterium]
MSGATDYHGFADGRRVRCVFSAALSLLIAGCATTTGGSYHENLSLSVQVQFYAPDGATVVIRDAENAEAVIRTAGPLADRLEHDFEDFAVFDLAPGTYEFAYADAPGAEGATIYGELEIREPGDERTRRFAAHAFVPIRLASAMGQEAEHLLPSRDLSYTQGLEDREFAHLKQGDLFEQVYFIADLERLQQEHDVHLFQAVNDVDRELAVLDDREEYLDIRYEDARRRSSFRNPDVNVADRVAHQRFDRWGIEEPYVKISRKRQALQRERESLMLERRNLEAQRDRRNALLRSMKIVHRAGALVLATPDLKLPFRDSVEQASELGEVLAVVRIGGRHQYWAWAPQADAAEDAEENTASETTHQPAAHAATQR